MTRHDRVTQWILEQTGNSGINYSASTLALFVEIYQLGIDDAQQEQRDLEEKEAKRNMVKEINNLLS